MDASFVCEDSPPYLSKRQRKNNFTPIAELTVEELTTKKLAAVELASAGIEYPESDGRPMAETDLHRNTMFCLIEILKEIFPQSYISGNLCLYYSEGDPLKWLSPDVLVALDGSPGERRIYKTWEEAPIDFVMEISSRSTKTTDYQKKMGKYARILSIPDYVIFDPENPKNFHVFRLQGRKYKQRIPNAEGKYYFESLQLYLKQEDGIGLRFFDKNHNPILTAQERTLEAKQKREQAEKQTKEERLQRKEAEKQAKEAGKQAKEAGKQAKEAEKQAKEAEKQAKEAEKENKGERLQRKKAEKQAKKAEKQTKEERLQREQAEKKVKEVEKQVKQAKKQAKQAEEQAKQAEEQAKQAEEQVQNERIKREQLEKQLKKEKEQAKLEGELENIEKLYQLGMLNEENYQSLKQSLQNLP